VKGVKTGGISAFGMEEGDFCFLGFVFVWDMSMHEPKNRRAMEVVPTLKYSRALRLCRARLEEPATCGSLWEGLRCYIIYVHVIY
jgi:hypothetical protein